MNTSARFVTRPYRYADGVAYNPNLFQIKVWDEAEQAPAHATVGGIIKAGDKWFAYAGSATLLQSKIDRIKSLADAVAWGSSKAEAASKIKPFLVTR